MVAIHSHNSSLHSGPPNPNGTKRSRRERAKPIEVGSSEDDEGPFTLKPAKGKGLKET